MDKINDMQAKARLVSKLDGLLQQITIGYVRYQIWGPESDKFVWGAVNDRSIDMARKKEMYESLKLEGPQQAKSDTVIKMLMKPSWFDNDTIATIDGKDIMDVPLLILTEEGLQAQKDQKLRLLEGLGRRGGVELWERAMNDDITVTNAKLKKISDIRNRTAEHETEKTALEAQKNGLEQAPGEAQWWLFRVLNQGELNTILAPWLRCIVNDLRRSVRGIDPTRAGGGDGAVGEERDTSDEA